MESRRVSANDLVRVSLDGRSVDGANAPTSELALHLAALRVRPDVAWSLHLHPPMATLMHALEIPIRTITTDHAFFLRSIARCHTCIRARRNSPTRPLPNSLRAPTWCCYVITDASSWLKHLTSPSHAR